MMTSKIIKRLKWIGLTVIALILLYWFATTLATELLRHREKTLSVLAGIESIKHWFIVMRLSIYALFYFCWGWMLRRLKPEITDETIVRTRKMLGRFFIVYELLFGVNIIAFVLH